jgi:hypothetical protein
MIDYYNNPGDFIEDDDDGVVIALLEAFEFEVFPDLEFEGDSEFADDEIEDVNSIDPPRKADLRRRRADGGAPAPVGLDSVAATTTSTDPFPGFNPHAKPTTSDGKDGKGNDVSTTSQQHSPENGQLPFHAQQPCWN